MGKVLEVIEDRGGIEALERESADKAAAVYEVIDTSGGFYLSPVAPAVRSHMNVVFRLPSQDLETAFLAEARRRRMVGLKGHRSVGGIRASLYAACRMESVEALTSFMREFAASAG
jgi:phosphoserine aminotransferase